MKLNKIHHVAVIVSDYEKSKDFYVNQLGFLNNIFIISFGILQLLLIFSLVR